MKSYSVEFMTTVYLTMPITANSRREAEALADKMLTRHSVWAETSDDLPEDTAVSIDGKGWEFNRDIVDEDDES